MFLDPTYQGIKILLYSSLAFVLGMVWAPVLIKILTILKFWKKQSRKVAVTGEDLVATKQFYIDNEEAETRKYIPRGGGILIWVTTILFALFFWFILQIDPTNKFYQFLNFISRKETFIPLGTLFFASLVGLIDDTLSTMKNGGNYIAGGLKLSHRLILVALMSTFIGWWFYYKLDITTIKLPLYNLTERHWINFDLQNISLPLVGSLGWLIIPLIVLILVSIWSTSIIDGFDGLATGVFIPVFLCFAGLAFIDKYYNIATLLMVMVGTMWAYLWFNIPPAKFFLGDTGTMGVLMTLGVVAIFINKVYVLPIAGLLLYLVAISAIIQVFSKKFFKKKIFLAAPLHHHLEAKGWTREQVTMRFWMISTITSLLGFAVGLLVK